MDGRSNIFPLYPTGPTKKAKSGETEPKPIARGKQLTLAPEDPERRITIKAKKKDGGRFRSKYRKVIKITMRNSGDKVECDKAYSGFGKIIAEQATETLSKELGGKFSCVVRKN